MSQIEQAVKLARQLETLLEQKHRASGKGLHEKVSSVEGTLPADLVKQLRYIATVRNSVVHEDGYVIKDPAKFLAAGNAALAQLGGARMGTDGPYRKVHISDWSLGDWIRMTIIVGSVIAGAVLGVSLLGGWIGAGLGFLLGLSLGGFLIGNPK